MNDFDPKQSASSRMPLQGFDRIVSIEMFEHMRNWEKLLGRIRTWMHEDGRFFAHVFAHRTHPYQFEDDQPEAIKGNAKAKRHGNWMGEHFFSGGIMPSRDLFHQFHDQLAPPTALVVHLWDITDTLEVSVPFPTRRPTSKKAPPTTTPPTLPIP